MMKFNYENNNLLVKKGDFIITKSLMKIKELNTNEKIYLAIYLQTDKKINNADKYMKNIVSKVTLNKIKKKLINLGYIKILTKKFLSNEEVKQLTIKNSHKGNKCEWCCLECYVLQEHHYPIPKSKNGEKKVMICPNCHYTYHKIINDGYLNG